jgi:hypothetical protein
MIEYQKATRVEKAFMDMVGEPIFMCCTPIAMLMPLTDQEIDELIDKLSRCVEYTVTVSNRQLGFPGTGSITVKAKKTDDLQNSASQLPEAPQT